MKLGRNSGRSGFHEEVLRQISKCSRVENPEKPVALPGLKVLQVIGRAQGGRRRFVAVVEDRDGRRWRMEQSPSGKITLTPWRK